MKNQTKSEISHSFIKKNIMPYKFWIFSDFKITHCNSTRQRTDLNWRFKSIWRIVSIQGLTCNTNFLRSPYISSVLSQMQKNLKTFRSISINWRSLSKSVGVFANLGVSFRFRRSMYGSVGHDPAGFNSRPSLSRNSYKLTLYSCTSFVIMFSKCTEITDALKKLTTIK